MTIQYLILAHKNPKQLRRLIDRLSSVGCFFHIHIDRNSQIEDFKKEIPETTQIHYLADRFRHLSGWGDFGAVAATVELMRHVIDKGQKGYCILLSGQDYPLKNNHKYGTSSKQIMEANSSIISICQI